MREQAGGAVVELVVEGGPPVVRGGWCIRNK